MIKSYLLIAFRNIFRSKLFSAVNILGLTFGMASALLIFLWVNDELSVNQFHSKIDRLYRVMENQTYSGKIYTFEATPAPMAPEVKEKYPEIEFASRWTWQESPLLAYKDKSFKEQGRWVDPDFLLMFDFPMISGDKNTALSGRNSIILTERYAKKLFGDEDPIGKTIVKDTKDSYQVTAVIKDLPPNNSLTFEFLLPFPTYFELNKGWLDSWGNNNVRTFLMLKEGVDVTAFSNKFKDEVRAHDQRV
ncbi:MAG: ABC transporter permease [Bacteroidota bacterium]